ncbi:hypothetical protein GY45DRAFT_924928 [Cubamyces sp. BRFM 1775]|nr:hypothetical protein GY45DRAFT_924928 [Cubamyces sp. BRFM 1775]
MAIRCKRHRIEFCAGCIISLLRSHHSTAFSTMREENPNRVDRELRVATSEPSSSASLRYRVALSVKVRMQRRPSHPSHLSDAPHPLSRFPLPPCGLFSASSPRLLRVHRSESVDRSFSVQALPSCVHPHTTALQIRFLHVPSPPLSLSSPACVQPNKTSISNLRPRRRSDLYADVFNTWSFPRPVLAMETS